MGVARNKILGRIVVDTRRAVTQGGRTLVGFAAKPRRKAVHKGLGSKKTKQKQDRGVQERVLTSEQRIEEREKAKEIVTISVDVDNLPSAPSLALNPTDIPKLPVEDLALVDEAMKDPTCLVYENSKLYSDGPGRWVANSLYKSVQ